MKSLEERMADLEVRYTQQEDLVQQLDEVVRAQQAQIEELAAGLRHFHLRLKEQADDGDDPSLEDMKPPHY